MSIMRDLYKLHSRKLEKIKENYINDTTLGTAVNELCCGTGRTSYGESKISTKISMLEIQNILNDFENSKQPTPQIMLKLQDLKNTIIIIEIDSFDDEPMPFTATDRIALYTAKLSKNYNVLALAMSIDKDENCKIIDSIYQKNNESYYTQLHLPKTVLTAVEYIDIMKRL